MRFGWRNLADIEVRRVGSEIETLPGTNVQVPHLSQKWHVNGSNTSFIIFDMGTPQSCSLLGVFGTNLTSSATFRLLASDIDPDVNTSLLLDTGTIAGAVKTGYGSIAHSFAPVTARYWRLRLTDDTLLDNLQVGRIFLGPSWTPLDPDSRALGPLYNWSVQVVDQSRIVKSHGGQTFIDVLAKVRILDLTISWADESQMYTNAFAMAFENGLRTDVFAIREESSAFISEQSVWGLITDWQPLVHEQARIFRQQITIEERL